jgi:hypothetical protein
MLVGGVGNPHPPDLKIGTPRLFKCFLGEIKNAKQYIVTPPTPTFWYYHLPPPLKLTLNTCMNETVCQNGTCTLMAYSHTTTTSSYYIVAR